MLKVTVELYPGGDKDKSEVLSELEIWNTGKTDAKTLQSIYGYDGYTKNLYGAPKPLSGLVRHWRPQTLWVLLYRIASEELLKGVYDTIVS